MSFKAAAALRHLRLLERLSAVVLTERTRSPRLLHHVFPNFWYVFLPPSPSLTPSRVHSLLTNVCQELSLAGVTFDSSPTSTLVYRLPPLAMTFLHSKGIDWSNK